MHRLTKKTDHGHRRVRIPGSGKTAAFLLPIFTRLLRRGPAPMLHGKCSSPTALILAPTRELAAQIFREAQRVRLERAGNSGKG